jgi:hypothetical protein
VISGIWLAVALAAAGFAAPDNTPGRSQDKKTEDRALIERPPVQWLKLYSLPIFRESWRLDGSVKSLDHDMPRVREAFSKVGAALVKLDVSGRTWKLSYRCPRESAQRALAELGQVGIFGEPEVSQLVEPVSRAEVRGKLQALEADKAAHPEDLAKMPAVAALVEELLGHLRGVEAALGKPEVEVLVHLTVKEKG